MKFDLSLSDKHVKDITLAACGHPQWADVQVSLVGTMFTHGEGEDYDYVVLLPDVTLGLEAFTEKGYTHTGEPSGTEDEFATLRKGEVNIMLTDEPKFYREFRIAAEVTKYVNGLLYERCDEHGTNKAERIRIHRIIMNGEQA